MIESIFVLGEMLVVGDVGTKSIKCLSSSPEVNDPLLWTYKMDMPRGNIVILLYPLLSNFAGLALWLS